MGVLELKKKKKVFTSIPPNAKNTCRSQPAAMNLPALRHQLHQRRLIESETSHWRFISCISVFLPQSRPFRRLETILSPFVLIGEMNAITDNDQFFSLFTRHRSVEHLDTKTTFFRPTNQEKMNFVWDLSLSQQHTLLRFGNRCFPPCLTTDINRHLNGLIGETMN